MSELRDAVPAAERIRWSEELCRNVERDLLSPLRSRLRRPLIVCAYAAFRSEADPFPLIRHCWDIGDTVVAPRISDGSMELRIVRESADWQPGPWNVPQPDAARTETLPDHRRPDVVLVPGLAFHPDGSRLGYGGGYYDRLYAAEMNRSHGRIRWVGFAWSVQLTPDPLPSEPHDLKLDVLATEQGVIWLNGEAT